MTTQSRPIREAVYRWRSLCRSAAATHAVEHELRAGVLPTLVACSGGADSAALAIALHAADVPDMITLAYVRHPVRTRAQTDGDLDAVRSLAASINAGFVHADLPQGTGRSEADLRDARYAALTRLALDAGCRCIATGHHADDQAETVLMRLARGSGPSGLAGIPVSRCLSNDPPLSVIRPLLTLRKAECVSICDAFGFKPVRDVTNDDSGYTRNALRAEVMPGLEAAMPGATEHIAGAASLFADLAQLVRERADGLRTPSAGPWDRDRLAEAPEVVLCQVIRDAFAELTGGRGLDHLNRDTCLTISRHIRSGDREPKRLDLPHGVEIRIGGRIVRIERSLEGGNSAEFGSASA